MLKKRLRSFVKRSGWDGSKDDQTWAETYFSPDGRWVVHASEDGKPVVTNFGDVSITLDTRNLPIFMPAPK